MLRRSLASLCVLSAVLAGCTTEATQVIVIFDTNADPSRLTAISASLGSGDRQHFIRSFGSGGTNSVPASFGIVPAPGLEIDRPVTLRMQVDVSTGLAGEPPLRFARVARFAFTPHRTTVLRIYLPVECSNRSAGCVSVPAEDCTVSIRCEETGQTCGDRASCDPVDSIPVQESSDASLGEHAAGPVDAVALDQPSGTDTVATDASDETPLDDVPIAFDGGGDVTAFDVAADRASSDAPSLCPGTMHTCGGICVWNSSSATCGSACMPCPIPAHATATCDGVSCGASCSPGFADCNATLVDGCETDLSAPATCGSCGNACTASLPVCANAAGAFSCAPSCPPPQTLCSGTCADVSSDVANCGGCGRACAPRANASVQCAAGACSYACSPGFHACGVTCANSSSTATCGSRCTPCSAPPNATATCDGVSCGFSCDAGFVLAGSSCVASPPPRAISPLSVATVSTTSPILSWVLPASVAGARVTLCTDRSMRTGCTTIDATGSSVRTPAALAAGVWFWRLQSLAGTAASPLASPVWEFRVGRRATAVDSEWDSMLDVNGDGFGDVAVGAPDSARASIFIGSVAGVSSTASTSIAGPAMSRFGAAISTAGDVNGDGFSDVIVASTGSLSLYLGSAAGLRTTPASTVAAPVTSVAAAGDVNHDGYADVIAGARGTGATVYLGGPSGLSVTQSISIASPLASFGASVAPAGDVDGDGFADVLVVAPDEFAAFVFAGSAAGIATTAAARFDHATSADCAGDIDGDGYSDIVIGAASESAVYFARGGATGLGLLEGPLTGSGSMALGGRVAGAGDVDGDGLSDVVATDAATQSVWAFRGNAIAGLDATGIRFTGSITGFGTTIAGAGDTERDGFDDIATGAPASASVVVLTGSPSTTLEPGVTLTGPAGFGEL